MCTSVLVTCSIYGALPLCFSHDIGADTHTLPHLQPPPNSTKLMAVEHGDSYEMLCVFICKYSQVFCTFTSPIHKGRGTWYQGIQWFCSVYDESESFMGYDNVSGNCSLSWLAEQSVTYLKCGRIFLCCFFCGLFYNAMRISEFIVSKRWMILKWWAADDFGMNLSWTTRGIVSTFSCINGVKLRKLQSSVWFGRISNQMSSFVCYLINYFTISNLHWSRSVLERLTCLDSLIDARSKTPSMSNIDYRRSDTKSNRFLERWRSSLYCFKKIDQFIKSSHTKLGFAQRTTSFGDVVALRLKCEMWKVDRFA